MRAKSGLLQAAVASSGGATHATIKRWQNRLTSIAAPTGALATAILLLPVACNAGTPSEAADMHLLVDVQGAVQLRRSGWSKASLTGAGATLQRGDLVLVPAGGRAIVACADLTLKELPVGRFSGLPCAAPEKTTLVYEGSLLAATRGDDTDALPQVLSPRRTRLLSPRPMLRWTLPRGAGQPTVAVKGPGVTWTARPAVGTTSMSYPADAPALQPDVVYRVSVTASGRSSDDAAEPSSGFSVMGGEAAEQARAGLARIGQLGLAPDAARLLSAHFLAARGLSAEAVEQLDAAAPTARPLLLLGALYQAVGLTRLAEEHHRRAAAAAAKSGDIEAQAQAQLALGTLYMEAFGLREDAARAFGDAAALFDRLGDQASARRATEKASHAKSS